MSHVLPFKRNVASPFPLLPSLSRRTRIPSDISSSLLLSSFRDEVFLKHLVLTAKAISVSPPRVLLYDWTSFSPMHFQVHCLECRNNCYRSSGVFIAFLSSLNNKFHCLLQVILFLKLNIFSHKKTSWILLCYAEKDAFSWVETHVPYPRISLYAFH